MNLLLRFLWVMLAAVFFRPRIHPLGESTIRLRVLPNDLDLNLHLNNGRYLSLMDLGRMDLLGRAGLATLAFRGRWLPMVGSATIRFIRPLALFESYELRTRLAGWDEKWFYFEQRFEKEGELKAVGYIKGLLRARGRNLPPAEVAEALGIEIESPPMPEGIRAWRDGERTMRG